MKRLFIIGLLLTALITGCQKENIIEPTASFNFRGDTASVLKMATYDTCTIFNSSNNADSSYWDLGDGNISSAKNVIITFPKAGTYNVKLTAKTKEGLKSSIVKKVIVLDRVLKKIIIKSIYWDTIPNNIPGFNSIWPTSSKADVYILVQKFAWTDSIVPYSGIMPNSPILYQSPVIHNVSNKTTSPIEINLTDKFIVDKKTILDKTFAISLMAIDKQGIVYAIQTSLESGGSFGILEENFTNDKFIVTSNLFSSIEFDCQFE